MSSKGKSDSQIHNAMEALYKGVQRHARDDDDKFFENIKKELNKVCEAIAQKISAQSCAVFFVTNDPSPELNQELIMRGASGSLKRSFDAYEKKDKKKPNGVVYQPIRGLINSKNKSELASLTQIVWHCGLARWANSRTEMERLRKTTKGGKGDRFAYPGPTLDKVFRNCVMVPIFAYGRVSKPLPLREIRTIIKQTGGVRLNKDEAKQHVRFMKNHRVVGILKVENKELSKKDFRRLSSLIVPNSIGSILEADCMEVNNDFACLGAGTCKYFKTKFGEKINELSPKQVLMNLGRQLRSGRNKCKSGCLEVTWGGKKVSYRWDRVCRELVDNCVRTFDATFSNQDVEILVTLAMQIGRILPWRTIQCASMNKVILDESEVGSLLIHREDIKGLAALNRACSDISNYMKFLFERLQGEFNYVEQNKISVSKKWGLLEPRNPIRYVDNRTKTYSRLLRKAIIRHDKEWEKVLKRKGEKIFTLQHLVRRLIGQTYDIRDIAGVRLTCDYLSDVEMVIDTICSKQNDWYIRILSKQDKIERPDISGYRAIHLDLLVRANGNIQKKDEETLIMILKNLKQSKTGLKFVQGNTLWLPCELQIRTAYEDSWAKKSHDLVYKLDRAVARLPKTLMDVLQILSNNLFEADRLSDIVQEQIHEFLTPEVGVEFQLRGLLGESIPRLPTDDKAFMNLPAMSHDWPFRYFMFIVDCARELYRFNIRYNGEGYFSHALSIALQLVSRFEFFPQNEQKNEEYNSDDMQRCVTLFALTMLHNCWIAGTNNIGLIGAKERTNYWIGNCVRALQKLIEDKCSTVINIYGNTIDYKNILGNPSHKWVSEFLKESRDFWFGELVNKLRHTKKTISFWDKIGKLKLSDKYLYDICRLRAAILIDELEDLPTTPNEQRRRERFKIAYDEFRNIRNKMIGITGGNVIIEECYKIMHKVAVLLALEIPINWYE